MTKTIAALLGILAFLGCGKESISDSEPLTPIPSCRDQVNLVDRIEVAKISEQGRIVCQNGIPISGVIVSIFDTDDALYSEVKSDENGNYHFADLRIGESYRVEFSYRDDEIISDNELELTQCGIIGNIDLDPLQRIAADLDHSNSVSAVDLLVMKNFRQNAEVTPWVFVEDASTEVLSDGFQINNYQGGIWTRDIIGVKKGDVARRFCE